MNNKEFLQILKKSFLTYLSTSARSNEKLKILHGAFSEDIEKRLRNKEYKVFSLGFEEGKEKRITGRYVDKAVDITIKRNSEAIAGIAVKFVMSNYSQNSNNYFENMLGETANIRSAKIPYFQIFIVPEKMPYFDKKGKITSWDIITEHNIHKYIKLSTDNIDQYMHTPNKTLIYIIDMHVNEKLQNKKEYEKFYTKKDFNIITSKLNFTFGNNIIYNDYETFANKIIHYIKSL